PVPAFKRGSSSRTTIASTTASRAELPDSSMESPRAPDRSAASCIEAFDPAPQCVRRTGRTRPARKRSLSTFPLHSCLRHRGSIEANLEVRDSTLQFVSDGAQFVHRLARGPGNRPIFSFVLRANRASIEAVERDVLRAGPDQFLRRGARG